MSTYFTPESSLSRMRGNVSVAVLFFFKFPSTKGAPKSNRALGMFHFSVSANCVLAKKRFITLWTRVSLSYSGGVHAAHVYLKVFWAAKFSRANCADLFIVLAIVMPGQGAGIFQRFRADLEIF